MRLGASARGIRLPDIADQPTPFEQAAEAIQSWLDGPGSEFATRINVPGTHRKVAMWEFELHHPQLGVQQVRFSIRQDFPATLPELHFSKRLCLALPHIEEDGRFCHGVMPSPDDYASPIDAARAVLERLQTFWVNAQDPEWIRSEFHKERLSYWLRFCDLYRSKNGAAGPKVARVVLKQLNSPSEGKIALYFRNTQKANSELLLAVMGDSDPHALAMRHSWSKGTLVRGDALFVPMPDDESWCPGNWPRTFPELDQLIAKLSDHQHSITSWIKGKPESNQYPCLVVLVQGSVCFGYLVLQPLVPNISPPRIVPTALDRVDADWALARDHRLSILHDRRSKRVLVLGCGSLGAPIAELLARAGVGAIHLLDKESFESENCSRHLLGAGNIGYGKADELAKRLRSAIPELEVKPYRAVASDWLPKICKPGSFDLVVDCTGESSIRCMLAHYRDISLGACPLVHAWLEPYCAAAHNVYLAPGTSWPVDDPTPRINVAKWPENSQVNLPACGVGFHPYGVADAWQAAGFTVERLLGILDGKVKTSTVWSWVRSKAFFEALDAEIEVDHLGLPDGSPFDSIHITRPLSEVLGDD